MRALAGERRTTAQLASRLGMTSQGMAKIVDDMIASGYLTRHANPADARVKLLDLSPRGRKLLKTAREFHRDFERRLGQRGPLMREILTDLASSDNDLERILRPM